MKLSTFSLTPKKNQEEQVQEVKFESKKITELASRNAYIESDPKQGCPVFHIKGNYQDSKEEFHLTFKLSKELDCINFNLADEHPFRHYGCLEGLEYINEQKYFQQSLKQYMQTTLYLGALYNVFSYYDLPISLIQENSTLLDKFADDSCIHYGHSKEDFKPNITEFLNSLSIEKTDVESKRENEFVILGRDDTSRGMPCLGVIGITKQYVYCKLKTTETHKLEYPKEFKFDGDSRCNAAFVASMVHILLPNLGILPAGDVTYRSSDSNYKSDLSISSFSGRKILSHDEMDAALLDADIFKTNKQIKME